MKRRVVITGIGPVTSLGIGRTTFFERLCHYQMVLQRIPLSFERNYIFKSQFLVPAPKISLGDYGLPASLAGAMEKNAQLSVVGAKLALEDAGFRLGVGERYFEIEGLKDGAVIIGVGMSSLQAAFDSYLAHLSVSEQLSQIKSRFNRLVIPMLMPNAVAAWPGIIFGIKGTSYTINAACASGTFAIGEAYRKIADGYCSTVLTGGVEYLGDRDGAVMRGFDQLDTLTRAEDGQPLPFSTKRTGFLFNEGAGCILVLEELNSALARGVEIYAELCGYESNSDAFNIVQMHESGREIIKLLQRLIKQHRIDYLNTHGTGTLTNDAVEAKVIQEIFGDHTQQPLLNSTKGILGHSIGASGALEAAVTALSIYHRKVHGNFVIEPLENLNLLSQTTDVELNYAISTSYGFGGHHAAILLKRYDQRRWIR